MLTATLIILSLWLALMTVRGWWYRKLWRSSVSINASLVEELDRAVTANYELQTRLNGKVAGEAYVRDLEWREILGEK